MPTAWALIVCNTEGCCSAAEAAFIGPLHRRPRTPPAWPTAGAATTLARPARVPRCALPPLGGGIASVRQQAAQSLRSQLGTATLPAKISTAKPLPTTTLLTDAILTEHKICPPPRVGVRR